LYAFGVCGTPGAMKNIGRMNARALLQLPALLCGGPNIMLFAYTYRMAPVWNHAGAKLS